VTLPSHIRRSIQRHYRIPQDPQPRSASYNSLAESIITQLRKTKPTENQHALNLADISPTYQLLISDQTVNHPFAANLELILLVNNEFKKFTDESYKAKAIFDWMNDNIEYRWHSVYANSTQTLQDRYGVCGEMTFLYVTMARSAGLEAKCVHVTRDNSSHKVNHACAAAYLHGQQTLVDVAYHTFDIKHRQYRVLTDNEAMELYKSQRNRLPRL
jgi:transglutaminase-like putative cysteine protease